MTESSDYLLKSSREYSLYVCETRAIPKVHDGLKSGQRIMLWLLRNQASKMKTIALTGLAMAEKLYVHGDASANSSIGLLAAPYNNNVPFIEGLGQFGNRVAPVEGIGAPRYTEVKRAKAAEAILYRDLDLVPLKDNYDGSNKEPSYFLPLIPTILLNGVSGIAVGWSTQILPRSLKGLIQATQDALNNEKEIRGLEPYFERYDVKVSRTGHNQWEFTGKGEVIDTSTIRITELPPGEKVENFRKKLNDMEEDGRISSYQDRSKDRIDITVKFKRGSIGPKAAETEIIDGKKVKIPAKKAWTEQDIISFFGLRDKITERIVTINWDTTGILTYDQPEQLVRDFVSWRLGWYTNRFQKMINDANFELIYWQVLKALFKSGFPKKLGTFINRQEMEKEVTKVTEQAGLDLVNTQLDRVVSVPTYRWTKDFEQEVLNKINELSSNINEYTNILKSPTKLKNIYLKEIEEIKKLEK